MTTQSDAGAPMRALTLRLDDELFAIAAESVREILDLVPVTEVPNAAPFAAGLINVEFLAGSLTDLTPDGVLLSEGFAARSDLALGGTFTIRVDGLDVDDGAELGAALGLDDAGVALEQGELVAEIWIGPAAVLDPDVDQLGHASILRSSKARVRRTAFWI